MTSVVNPILPITALLRPQMPAIYERATIYDPTWDSPAYAAYTGQRVVPAVSSLVRDVDESLLWVVAIDPTTLFPTYLSVPRSDTNDNVVSLLDYGNSLLRLYGDYRALPYPVTPDSKCVVLGKSPRFYTLVRHAGTPQESIISQYFNSGGTLESSMIPLVALDTTQSSWYLPRCHVSVLLDANEEVETRVYSEDGTVVFTAKMFATESAVINEDVIYSPTIMGMTVTGNQRLPNGTFFLYEKQDFESLGLTVSLIYDNGSTQLVPLDGEKCILYGDDDFISSFAGLKQYVTVKYFRSRDENINVALADATGEMISIDVPVTVIPNAFATTNKVLVIPSYNANLGQYVLRYWLYFADGRSHIDVTPFTSITAGSVATDPSHYGVVQTYAIGVNMNAVDPVNYPVNTVYQQNVVIRFGAPNSLVKWTIRDALSSPFLLGQDISTCRRPAIRYDGTRQQYFIPTNLFGNLAAFLNSFYTQAAPPYDPTISEIPQVPTHFVVRDMITGNQLVSGKIAVGQYGVPFNIIGDTTGNYVNAMLMVEFLNQVNGSTTNILFACPVDVTTGTYL